MQLARMSALLVSAASLAVIIAFWMGSCGHGYRGDRAPSGMRAQEPIPSEVVDGLSRQLDSSLRKAPIEQGHLGDLTILVNSLTHALLSGNPAQHIDLMERRGFIVSERVFNLLEQYHEIDLLLDIRKEEHSPSEVFTTIWEAIDTRDMRVIRVLPESAEAGAGVRVSAGPAWNFPATLGQLSLFDYREAAKPVPSSFGKPSLSIHEAWVQFDAEFSSGYQSKIRLMFYFDPAAKMWVPYGVVVGAVNGHRPIPLI